ncbi:MAG: hypothetical protein K8Q99_04890 [Acholeplasmataceae bacterium]|nr:hypothetical protein [Acholeplasmataceae bacterium]
MKFLKIFLSAIIGLIVVMVVVSLIFINKIKLEVTDDELPQAVYTDTSDLNIASQAYLTGLLLASDSERYNMIAEFMNYMLLDSIRENINADYDPLADLDTIEANYIIHNDNFYIDYLYANLNDDNQLVVTAAFGSNMIFKVDSALILVFDIDTNISITSLGFTLTLVDYSLSDTSLSIQILDFIFSRLDKTQIEDYMNQGDLDLDNYTYDVFISIP